TAVLLAATAVTGYVRDELVDADAFSARASSSLQSGDVREVVAGKVVDGIAGGVAPDVLAVRPLVQQAIVSIAGTARFQRIFERAVAAQHRTLFHGHARAVLDLEYAGSLLRESLRSVSPRVAERIPPGTEPQLAALDADDTRVTVARAL